MTKLTGFGTFAALPDEQHGEKISRRILSGKILISTRAQLGSRSLIAVTSTDILIFPGGKLRR